MIDMFWFFTTVAIFCALGIYAKGRYGAWQHAALISFTLGSSIGFVVRIDSGLVASVVTQVAVAVAVMILMMVSDRFAVRARKTP